MDGLIRKILNHCGCIPHYFPQNTYKNCSLQVHAECVTPMINAFKGSSNKCEKACDSRFYKQQTIMYGRLRHINLPSADISTGKPICCKKGSIRPYSVGVQLNQDDVSEFFSFEQPSYNYYEFISDIGGELGLILGLSVQELYNHHSL